MKCAIHQYKNKQLVVAENFLTHSLIVNSQDGSYPTVYMGSCHDENFHKSQGKIKT
jgi:hypothetical protein